VPSGATLAAPTDDLGEPVIRTIEPPVPTASTARGDCGVTGCVVCRPRRRSDYVLASCGVAGCPACGRAPTPDEVAAELRAAVALLDVTVPRWRRVVDPVRLDMTSSTRCVLGQVFGDYLAGRQALVELTGSRSTPGLRAFLGSFPVEPWRAELTRAASRPAPVRLREVASWR
jgi:hypothetical protein